jgi:hypothetical protein
VICAACGAGTEVDPCGVCGQAALLDGRFRLDSAVSATDWRTCWAAVRVDDGRTCRVWETVVPPGLPDAVREGLLRAAPVADGAGFVAPIAAFLSGRGRGAALLVVEGVPPGRMLRQVLADGPVAPPQMLELLEELLTALAGLHAPGAIGLHGDLHPDSVWVDTVGGRVWLAGACPMAGHPLGRAVANAHGYLAPERAHDPAGAAADLYAVGCIAASMLSGCDAGHLMNARGQIEWARAGRLHPGLDLLLRDLTQPDPMRRLATAARARARVAELRAIAGPLAADLPTDEIDDAARTRGTQRTRMERRHYRDMRSDHALLLLMLGSAAAVGLVWLWRGTGGL